MCKKAPTTAVTTLARAEDVATPGTSGTVHALSSNETD
jgi:hypothetical protein